jgi:hypothetical protein
VRDRVLAAEEDARRVDLQHALPRVQAGDEDRVVVGRRDAGVVERDVDSPVPFRHPVEERPDGLLVADVAGDELAAHLVGGGLAGLRRDVDADHLGSLGRKPSRGGQPDAAPGAGDDGDPILQTLHR